VVVLADRAPGYDTSRSDWQTTKLFHVTPGMLATPEAAVADWGERNMGDPATLIEFVQWTRANYPAQRYALYFWGHGWNMHQGYTMVDDSSGDALDPAEIRAALPSIGFIHMVGWDGCNMASIEVEALWKGYATAMSHSQEYVNWDGIEYEKILPKLKATPTMSADQLAIETTLSAQGNTERTWSAVAVDGRMDAVVSALDAWARALKTALPKERKKLAQAFGATESFWQVPYEKDLKDMVQEVNARVTDAQVKSTGNTLLAALNAAILAEWSTNAYPNANGITIYHIDKASQKSDPYYSQYKLFDLSGRTQWDEFLDAYAQ